MYCETELISFGRGGVAQLVRVPPCHGGCCGFDPRLSRHFYVLFVNTMAATATQTSFFYAGE